MSKGRETALALESSFDSKLTDAEKRQADTFQAMLQYKCDELRSEFADIRATTEQALADMSSTKVISCSGQAYLVFGIQVSYIRRFWLPIKR